jgi:hypothetical protein
VRTTYHIPALERHPAPKRGDILQSNVGKRTERTWLILHVKEKYPRHCPQMGGIVTRPYKIWAERWWELEPEMRVRLFQSAERAGGQVLHLFERFTAKKKRKTFEQYLGA